MSEANDRGPISRTTTEQCVQRVEECLQLWCGYSAAKLKQPDESGIAAAERTIEVPSFDNPGNMFESVGDQSWQVTKIERREYVNMRRSQLQGLHPLLSLISNLNEFIWKYCVFPVFGSPDMANLIVNAVARMTWRFPMERSPHEPDDGQSMFATTVAENTSTSGLVELLFNDESDHMTRMLTLIAMRYAFTLLSSNTVREDMFSEETIRRHLRKGFDVATACPDGSAAGTDAEESNNVRETVRNFHIHPSSTVVIPIPLSYHLRLPPVTTEVPRVQHSPPVSSLGPRGLFIEVSEQERAYLFYATMVLLHLASNKDTKEECIISDSFQMVFWVPTAARRGSHKLYGVPCNVLKITRPHAAMVGRKGRPLCMCPCVAKRFVDECQGAKYVAGPWFSGTRCHGEKSGTVWYTNELVVSSSILVLLLSSALAVLLTSTAVWVAVEDNKAACTSNNQTAIADSKTGSHNVATIASKSVQALYAGVLVFFLVLRGCTEIIGHGRTITDILLFRKEISFFDDLLTEPHLEFEEFWRVAGRMDAFRRRGEPTTEAHAVQKIRLLKGLMHSVDGARLAAKEGACYISNACSGKYRFREVTVADLKKCEPVIAGKGAFVWVGRDGPKVCEVTMPSAGMYHINRVSEVSEYCTTLVGENMIVT